MKNYGEDFYAELHKDSRLIKSYKSLYRNLQPPGEGKVPP